MSHSASAPTAERKLNLRIPRDKRVRRALLALGRDISLTPGRLAEIVGLSLSRLEVLVKRQVGTNLQTLRSYKQLRLARRLLISTDNPIKNIWIECAFKDAANFNHAFKRHFRLAPRMSGKLLKFEF